MNNSWSRILKSVYRREPVTSFIVTAGAVNIAVGGLSEHWALMTIGLGAVGVAIALRWWQAQNRNSIQPQKRPPVYALPPHSSRPSLPMLSMSKKNPPNR
ncbi:MAG: hypothetical protein HC866_23590 [Leptolyngbyaceae cyanobacterium RU_5_1]|nr:hypothetical protein [Leptolyngbyaceae cyanobacterium RU_5_1]